MLKISRALNRTYSTLLKTLALPFVISSDGHEIKLVPLCRINIPFFLLIGHLVTNRTVCNCVA